MGSGSSKELKASSSKGTPSAATPVLSAAISVVDRSTKQSARRKASKRNSPSQEKAKNAVLRAFRRRAWRAGGEHNLWDLLQEEGFVTREAFERLFAEDGGNEGVSAQKCFEWLDQDGDGKISPANFEERVTRQLFGEEFKALAEGAGESFLQAIGHRVAAKQPGKPVVHCLESMTDEEMSAYAQEAMGDFLREMKALRARLKELKKKTSGKSRAGLKFSLSSADSEQPKEFKFGTLAMFKQGLEKLIGIPAMDVREAMEREHQSTDTFMTGNYGVSTFDKQEFDLVDKGAPVSYEADFGRHSRVKQDVDVLLSTINANSDCASPVLTREEVVALVLYTGPLYERYNTVLREQLYPIATKLHEGQEVEIDDQIEYVTTIHMIVSGILKLSERSSRHDGAKVYRGLQGRVLPESLTTQDKAGYAGGTEMGFMSTTRSIDVAKQYAGLEDGAWPTIFAIETGQVDRGASLRLLSQYPCEDEVLLPPLCNLEMTGEPRVHWEGELAYWVVPMRLSVNLKCRTREQYQERRRLEVLGHARNVLADAQQAIAAKMARSQEKTERDKRGLASELLQQGRRLLQSLKARDAAWFQADANFGAALQDIINVKSFALEVVDAYLSNARGRGYYTQYSMTMWHRLKLGDARHVYEEALKRPMDEESLKAAAVQLAVLAGLLGEDGQDSTRGMDGDTAVMLAAAAGDEHNLKLLAHARCDLNSTDDRHCTALQKAVVAGNAHAVKTLIALGADKEKGLAASATSLESPLCHAAEFGRLKCLMELTKAGADVEAASSTEAGTPRPMALAAFNGHLPCLKWLQKAGADVRAVDNGGDHVLHWAVRNGHADVSAWLQIGTQTPEGARGGDAQSTEDVDVACLKWLKEAGADIKAVNKDGMQPIHAAAQYGQLQFVQWLHSVGADVRAASDDGRQAIHMAVWGEDVDCLSWLQEHGADINARDADGNQPVHYAARLGHLVSLQWLTRAGADLNSANGDGDRPVDEAERQQHAECVAWLRQTQPCTEEH